MGGHQRFRKLLSGGGLCGRVETQVLKIFQVLAAKAELGSGIGEKNKCRRVLLAGVDTKGSI